MKCVSCLAEIPPAWVNALAKNECPGCGGMIMTEDSKKLMDDLKDAMVKMPNDPEGLAGWLLSTYDLFPKGSVEPTEFHRKRRDYDEEGPALGPSGKPLKRANSASEKFMKRANVDKIHKNPKIAALQNALHSMQDSEMYPDENEELSVAEEEEDTSEMLKMMIAKSKQGGKKKVGMAELLANSSDFGNDGEELNPYELAKLQQVVGGSEYNSGDPEMDGFENLPPALQADRLKRLQAQRELAYGGSSGVIKRSHG